MRIEYRQIGTIHTPFKSIEGMPIQPAGGELEPGTVKVYPEYLEGLKDLDGFSHIILIYHFHKVAESKMIVTPFMDDQPRGVFATRAPKRPKASRFAKR